MLLTVAAMMAAISVWGASPAFAQSNGIDQGPIDQPPTDQPSSGVDFDQDRITFFLPTDPIRDALISDSVTRFNEVAGTSSPISFGSRPGAFSIFFLPTDPIIPPNPI
jgi:hypothetical protein